MPFNFPDGHKDSGKIRLHVCSPINFFVPTSDSIGEELSDEEKDMVTELLKSGIPTVILYSSAISISDFRLKLGDRLDGVSDKDIWVRNILLRSLEISYNGYNFHA